MEKRTLELFCGTKSFTREALKRGYEGDTLDINKRFNPTFLTNILHWDYMPYIGKYRIIWASPDCTAWSCASAFKYWNKRIPKHWYAQAAIRQVQLTLRIIDHLQPQYWFLENPTGKLRKMDFMQPYCRQQITYCQYGESRRKPTDIWTNNLNWKPRPICEVTDTCHPALTNDINSKSERARIPAELINEILDACE